MKRPSVVIVKILLRASSATLLLLLITTVVVCAAEKFTLKIGGEDYFVADRKASADGRNAIVELLRPQETLNNYSKMLAIRHQTLPIQDMRQMEQVTKSFLDSKYPGATQEVIHADSENFVTAFTLKAGDIVEYNLWHYRKTSSGAASAQWILRNRGAYQHEQEFLNEIEKNKNIWLKELESVSGEATAIIEKSGS